MKICELNFYKVNPNDVHYLLFRKNKTTIRCSTCVQVYGKNSPKQMCKQVINGDVGDDDLRE